MNNNIAVKYWLSLKWRHNKEKPGSGLGVLMAAGVLGCCRVGWQGQGKEAGMKEREALRDRVRGLYSDIDRV